jgi:superfamily II DNA/RNA helicase
MSKKPLNATNPKKTHPLSPRLMIITQSKELCYQILSVLQTLQLNIKAITLPPPMGIPIAPFSHPDIAVTTVEALHADYGKRKVLMSMLQRTEAVVVDEADNAMNQDNGRTIVTDILWNSRRLYAERNTAPSDSLRKIQKERDTQFVFVTATLPPVRGGSLEKSQTPRAHLLRMFPGIYTFSTFGVNLPPPTLTQSFIKIVPSSVVGLSPIDEFELKLAALQNLLEFIKEDTKNNKGPKVQQWLVFCNQRSTVEKLYDELSDYLLATKATNSEPDSVAMQLEQVHARTPEEQRAIKIAQFASGVQTPSVGDTNAQWIVQLLICTDVVARGVDFQHVNVVVSFDFPTNVSMYLNRVGRTARFGKPGDAVSLVGPPDEFLATKIEQTLSLSDSQAAAAMSSLFSRNRSIKKRH